MVFISASENTATKLPIIKMVIAKPTERFFIVPTERKRVNGGAD